ncbi:MAG TPA: flagellar protein FliT [Ramlibacter sp.]|nr:flagellar protein FliT [Ramlibacter sp.]
MGASEVLPRYEQLAGTLAHLVALARDRQWEHLPALEARCTALYDQLRSAPPEDLTPDDFSRVLLLASRIRRDQDALVQLVRPQFVRLLSDMRWREECAFPPI